MELSKQLKISKKFQKKFKITKENFEISNKN